MTLEQYVIIQPAPSRSKVTVLRAGLLKPIQGQRIKVHPFIKAQIGGFPKLSR